MAKLVKVFVKGWTEPHLKTGLCNGGHHSMPVRFKLEDGSYEWIWVRKNNITFCRQRKAGRARK